MADEKKKDSLHGKRAHPRVDSFNRVHVIPQDGTPMDVFSSNVSRGGMFLRSNQPLPAGKKVKLEFETINGVVYIDEGEIVWNRSFDPTGAVNQVSGMGVKFQSMSEESSEKIGKFIDEILSTSQTPATPTPKMSVMLTPPENSSPPERTASPRPLASQPIPSSPRTEPTAVTDRTGPMNTVDSSKPDSWGPSNYLQNLDERYSGSYRDDAPTGEEYMMLLSPPPRRRIFLFAGFVLLVAVVTFFTMLLIRPSVDESSGQDSSKITPRTTPQNQPTPTSTTDAKKVETSDVGTVTASTKPAPAPAQPPGKETSLPKAATVESNEQPMLANVKEPATDQPEVSSPGFEQRPNGWQMVINANRGLVIKHFALNAPPRLAIDFHGASFAGKSWTFEAPIPPVTKLRVGKQGWGVRFVLDFQGDKAPAYKINIEPASITVSFSQ